jgi:hypothetical protein
MPAKEIKPVKVRFELRLRPKLARQVKQSALDNGRRYNQEIEYHLYRAYDLRPEASANGDG